MNLQRARMMAQIGSIALIVLIPILNRNHITFITGTLYSMAIGPVWVTDPLIGLQAMITKLFIDKVLLLSMFIPAVLALLLGRVFCGWICPQNTLSELVDRAAQSLTARRLFRPSSTPVPRYIILGIVLALTIIAGIPVAGMLSAPGIISLQIAKFVYEGVVGLELGLIGLIVIFELFGVRRGWCNYACPVGGFLGLFRFQKTLKVVITEDAEHVCGKCNACVAACQLGLNPMEKGIYPLCHNCGACIVACEKMAPKYKPLSYKF